MSELCPSRHDSHVAGRSATVGRDDELGTRPGVCTRKVPSRCGDRSPGQASSPQFRRHFRVAAQVPDTAVGETCRLVEARLEITDKGDQRVRRRALIASVTVDERRLGQQVERLPDLLVGVV